MFKVFFRSRLCWKSMSKVLGQFACWSWFVSQLHIHSICVYRYMKNVTNRLFIEDAKKCKRSKTSFEWCCWLNSGISKNELTFIFFRLYARDASCHVSTYFMLSEQTSIFFIRIQLCKLCFKKINKIFELEHMYHLFLKVKIPFRTFYIFI